ncbi:AlpA family phage regulatory protein [Haliea sp.]|jgi:prophage regulatory protein|uniref:helix-turn-helix transcriptional regulator n=1 Tax=Haliea sp. TaxID=1932666 RepID=UPI000C65F26D|nr:AlpA family phage regulatory protein [Haliea sp.]MAD63846.1 hypothetical protein [Haliea sp.]MAY92207.1 hypothetical protein [Haliea sp.]MBK42131.1 hypothetical protein [Haliea sp.]MBP69809.1 hypothetical protein [Haliea sp.]|tara:strand:- start:10294 stop:10530 length:237 start_codon:yes stop_codon:yes gene_type:complete
MKYESDINVEAQNGPLLDLYCIQQVRRFLGGKSRSTIYRWVSEGRFPKPVKLGANSIAWPIEELIAWRDSLIQEGQLV